MSRRDLGRLQLRLEKVQPGCRRIEARDKRGSRGRADRGLAMSIAEKCAAFGETVDIRRLGLRMAAQTSRPVIQVVDRDDQDVWSLGAR